MCVVLRPATDGTLFHVREELPVLEAAGSLLPRKEIEKLSLSSLFSFRFFPPSNVKCSSEGIGLSVCWEKREKFHTHTTSIFCRTTS